MTASHSRTELSGVKVLIVEDEVLIALDYGDVLEQEGCTVIGPAPTEERALELLDDNRPDVALLDLNLNGQPPTALGHALRARSIPFGIVSGYLSSPLEDSVFAHAPRRRKPAGDAQLVELMRELVQARST